MMSQQVRQRIADSLSAAPHDRASVAVILLDEIGTRSSTFSHHSDRLTTEAFRSLAVLESDIRTQPSPNGNCCGNK
jgi:hypothetical protein